MTRVRFLLVAAALVAVTGCKELDGRNRNRQANRLFREMHFIEAAAEYEKALTQVPDPIIHYNAGLAYSKIAKGSDKLVLLGERGNTDVCELIPGVKDVQKRVCVKPGDRRFNECDDKNVCASSYQCKQTTLCAMPATEIANLATKHFQEWLKKNPTDTETEKQMTQVWLDASAFDAAIAYWEGRFKDKPNDPEIMGNLAGINLKAGEWRKSIEWYTKVAEAAKDPGNKIGAYQFIGNVAWSKLNSKTLDPAATIELADRGLGALQKAAELEPKNAKLFSLQASIFNFRANAHGSSWAQAIDRASAQDLLSLSRVLRDEAKKLQGEAPPANDNTNNKLEAPAQAGGSAAKTPG